MFKEGTGEGTGEGTEVGPGEGTGEDTGVRTGEGTGERTGVETGEGTREGTGEGTEEGTGVGTEEGTGVETGECTGVGTGEGKGVGIGVGTGVGTGEGTGVGTGEGTGLGVGGRTTVYVLLSFKRAAEILNHMSLNMTNSHASVEYIKTYKVINLNLNALHSFNYIIASSFKNIFSVFSSSIFFCIIHHLCFSKYVIGTRQPQLQPPPPPPHNFVMNICSMRNNNFTHPRYIPLLTPYSLNL